MIGKFLSELNLGKKYGDFISATRDGISIAAFGMSISEKCFAASLHPGSLYITQDEMSAQSAAKIIGQLVGEDNVVYVPPRDEVLLYKKAVSEQNLRQRIAAYAKLRSNRDIITVLPMLTLIQQLLPIDRIIENVVRVSVGDNIEHATLAGRLVGGGYKKVDMTTAAGEFSIRGEIFDIYPVGQSSPIRLDFFDTEIEQIKEFDPLTQLSCGDVKSAVVLPASDIFLTEQEIVTVIKKLDSLGSSARAQEIKNDIIFTLETHPCSSTLSYILPLIGSGCTLLDYFPKNTVVMLDEPKQIEAKILLYYREHIARFEGLLAAGEVYRDNINQYYKLEDIKRKLESFRLNCFEIVSSSNTFFKPRKLITFIGGGITNYNQNITELVRDLKNWRTSGYDVLIAGGVAAESVAEQLTQAGVNVSLGAAERFRGVTVCHEELESGFILHDIKAVIIGTYDIITRRKRIISRRNKKDVFVAPNIGDYVVHNIHGIGICRGTKQLSGQFGSKDYVIVEYSAGDMLYVPVDQMDYLSRYSGGEAPRLSKIGGKDFERLKARVRESVREMAIDLHRLYAERARSIGYAFKPDLPLQAEFEEKFPHIETEDQLKATAEIKKDMESGKAMDRLLCGDVGYGKTEVGFRAIFKAIASGKQAAMLCPTTVLSSQHFENAKTRFEGFGVNIEVLNRFKSAAECDQILRKLKSGAIDFIIGTHRLLSKDVQFKDLGLLVVDEEQRFGVEHKERIKAIKSSIDVLAMSATPIPRTLHMSMVGIRDISVLETPPQERLPVQAYIIEETDAVIKDAINKELARGGQVFVMINRVERISSVAARIATLVPDAAIATMHGQMNQAALEQSMFDFYNNVKNVLVCTTIIENGIDLPNANTLIILDSDNLGLSQLYQLKGRVGRSNRLAYCYFSYREGKVLSEDGYKRLKAIMECSEFGSGFKIAMRDLEIRGAGDVLGSKQHGHIEKVGYDMYVKLLGECVDDLKGIKHSKVETTIETDLSAFLSESYISIQEERMRVYRRISETASIEDRDELISELNDIYGEVPFETRTLIDISLIKKLAEKINAESVVIKKTACGIYFADNLILSDKRVMVALSECADKCLLTFTDRPFIAFSAVGATLGHTAKNILKFLQTI